MQMHSYTQPGKCLPEWGKGRVLLEKIIAAGCLELVLPPELLFY